MSTKEIQRELSRLALQWESIRSKEILLKIWELEEILNRKLREQYRAKLRAIQDLEF